MIVSGLPAEHQYLRFITELRLFGKNPGIMDNNVVLHMAGINHMNHLITCVCGNRFYATDAQLGQHLTCPACNRGIVPVSTQPAEIVPPAAPLPGAPTGSEATKRCPYCGETILAVARKCRYCNEFLDRPTTSTPPFTSATTPTFPVADSAPAIFSVSVSQWDNFFRYLICAAIVVVSGSLLYFVQEHIPYTGWIFTFIFAATALAAYYIYLTTSHTRCVIRANRIETESGIFAKKLDQLELFRVIDLELRQGFLERMLGIGTIMVKSNDPTSPTLELYQIPQAKNIYQYLQNQIPRAERERGAIRVEH